MKCIKCGISCTERMLHRTAPLGVTPANWMCLPCIETTEPELANNIKQDDDIKLLDIIEDEFCNQRNHEKRTKENRTVNEA